MNHINMIYKKNIPFSLFSCPSFVWTKGPAARRGQPPSHTSVACMLPWASENLQYLSAAYVAGSKVYCDINLFVHCQNNLVSLVGFSLVWKSLGWCFFCEWDKMVGKIILGIRYTIVYKH